MINVALDKQRTVLEVSELPIAVGGEVAQVVEVDDTLGGFEVKIAAAVKGKPYHRLRLDESSNPVAVGREPTAEEQMEIDRAATLARLRQDLDNPSARTIEEKVTDLITVVS